MHNGYFCFGKIISLWTKTWLSVWALNYYLPSVQAVLFFPPPELLVRWLSAPEPSKVQCSHGTPLGSRTLWESVRSFVSSLEQLDIALKDIE